MLSDNLKNFRKAKGLSQEELATKLNVVRQTISKWEKGLSVPDSEMLIMIAEELDTSVSVLLGETLEANEETELKMIAAKLELLNEQFAKRNERHRKIWRAVFITVIVLCVVTFLYEVIDFVFWKAVMDDINSSTSIIVGYDSPTSIYVSSISFKTGTFIAALVALVVSIIGVWKTNRK